MNVDILHYSAPPVVGGVESVIGEHARLMIEAGHKVRLLAGRGAQTDFRISYHEIPLLDSRHPEIMAVKKELDHGRYPDEFDDLTMRIRKELESVLTDDSTLIAHNVCSLHKNLPLTAAVRQISTGMPGLRLVLWHHDLAWTSARYRSELHPGYPWDLLRTPWESARQVVVSELRRQELSKLQDISPELIQVVPNGIDLAKFLVLNDETQDLTKPFNLVKADPLLLLPVRITRRKNIELALRTLKALCVEMSNPHLLVTGPVGPHNPDNRRYFKDLLSLRNELALEGRAIFLAEHSTKFLPHAVIADFFRLADALFLPSEEEGFGIPILEAGLAGIPIFCSDIPTLHDLAQDQATYFSPQADPTLLAKKIADRLKLDATYQMRCRVRQNFTWSQIYQLYIAPLLE